jgi:general stress protein CsbA
MVNFMKFTIILSVILIAVSLLIGPLMGIFIVCTVVSLLITMYDKEKERNHKHIE